jgi:hypothetical protein
MINHIKSAIRSATSTPATTAEEKRPTDPAPESALRAIPKTPREQSLETAAQVGYRGGEKVTGQICRHQPARHPKMLFVAVPDWAEPVVCWVKDAASWQPVCPPYDRIRCEFSGTADVEGRLVFQSADESKRNRLLRRK